MNYDNFERVAQSLVSKQWTFAKTMPKNPHWYTLRKKWQDDTLSFEDAVTFMREHGYKEKFKRTWYTMFDINEMKYWTMGSPLPSTILINRKPREYDTPYNEPYDAIAAQYDSLFHDEDSLQENVDIINMISNGGGVLDIGCGTGVFLDYHPVDPQQYTGIDPSKGMLDQLIAKHPSYREHVIQATLERFFIDNRKYDVIISLFGSMNYIDPQAYSRITSLLAQGGRFFLMFYKPEYTPIVCERSGIQLQHFQTDLSCFTDANIREYHNFLIVTNENLS